MCFNPSPERRVPSPNRYMAFAKFCFCKNNKRTIDRLVLDSVTSTPQCKRQPRPRVYLKEGTTYLPYETV